MGQPSNKVQGKMFVSFVWNLLHLQTYLTVWVCMCSCCKSDVMFLFQDLKHPHNGQEPGGMDSWPWFHLMNEAMQGRLFNANLTLVPESVCVDTPGVSSPLPNESGRENENQENTDILEFLIKTEMEDSGGTENVEGGGTGRTAGTPSEGIPIGWRRMSECTYKSMLLFFLFCCTILE